MEPRTPTQVLEDLSGIADDPFDWNDQEVRNVRKLFIGAKRVEPKWHLGTPLRVMIFPSLITLMGGRQSLMWMTLLSAHQPRLPTTLSGDQR
ncbi:MAG: hypothetical protein ACYTEX_27145 [Planctomycetota bacterium]